MPYNWRNPLGYLVTASIQFFLSAYAFQYIVCFMLLAFGIFMFAMALAKIEKTKLHSINKMASNKKLRKNMYKELSEFIRMNANGKQLCVGQIFGRETIF